MHRIKHAGIALLVAAFVASTASAEWPNLNPFSTGKKSTASSQKSWLPSWKKPAPRSGPTHWQKVKAAPGQMVTKTKETLAPLNPFKGEPAKKSIYAGPKDDKEESSWWNPWGGDDKPEKGSPNSVSDWLDNPRPE